MRKNGVKVDMAHTTYMLILLLLMIYGKEQILLKWKEVFGNLNIISKYMQIV